MHQYLLKKGIKTIISNFVDLLTKKIWFQVIYNHTEIKIFVCLENFLTKKPLFLLLKNSLQYAQIKKKLCLFGSDFWTHT